MVADGINKILGAPLKRDLESLKESKSLLKTKEEDLSAAKSLAKFYPKLNDPDKTEFWSEIKKTKK